MNSITPTTGGAETTRDAGRAATWNYLPALDGLRAAAITGVVLFHYWPSSVPGGFIGVDIFFARSDRYFQ